MDGGKIGARYLERGKLPRLGEKGGALAQRDAPIDEIAETVPKVEVDPETGKKSLVVSEKKTNKKGEPKPAPSPKQYPPRPPWHNPPQAPPPKGKVRLPVDDF